jgi:hypothetical protein
LLLVVKRGNASAFGCKVKQVRIILVIKIHSAEVLPSANPAALREIILLDLYEKTNS